MVDNQHRQIKGYRELTTEEIALMNEVKAKGEELRELLQKVRETPGTDARATAIAQTELQTALMWLTRAIARPESF
jgi:hypothetical protein